MDYKHHENKAKIVKSGEHKSGEWCIIAKELNVLYTLTCKYVYLYPILSHVHIYVYMFLYSSTCIL